MDFSSSIETTVNCKQDRPFTVSSNKNKAWARQGADLMCDYMVSKGNYNLELYNFVYLMLIKHYR
jgi:hypothetical protein